MKFKDYIDQQKAIKATDLQKIKIYENFLKNSERISFYKKISFYWKISVYTALILFLIFSFYYPLLTIEKADNKPIDIAKVWTWYFVEKKNNMSDFQVQAEYVWQVLESNWDFKIVKNGKEYTSNDIYDWDIILLMKKSTLKFQVNSWAVAYIQWPARLSVNYAWSSEWAKKYFINLIEWSYFEIKADEQTSKDNFVVRSDDFEIESKKIWTKLDFTILSDGEKSIVDNKWSEIIVKKVINNEKKFTSVRTNQKAEVSEEIKILQEVNKIKDELKKWDIAISYNVTWETIKTVQNNSWDIDFWTDVKSVLSEDSMTKLKDTLYSSFVMSDIQNLVKYYLIWDKSSFDISYKNLSNRIYKVYDLFWLTIDSQLTDIKNQLWEWWLDELYLINDQLIAKIQKWYYIPTQYTQKLNVIMAWIVLLKSKQFWEFSWEQNIEFDEILNRLNVKDSLILK